MALRHKYNCSCLLPQTTGPSMTHKCCRLWFYKKCWLVQRIESVIIGYIGISTWSDWMIKMNPVYAKGLWFYNKCWHDQRIASVIISIFTWSDWMIKMNPVYAKGLWFYNKCWPDHRIASVIIGYIGIFFLIKLDDQDESSICKRALILEYHWCIWPKSGYLIRD